MRTSLKSWPLLIVTVFWGGCADTGVAPQLSFSEAEAVSPDPQRAAAILRKFESGRPIQSSDEMLSYLNASIPGGLGGMFLNKDGTLSIYLKDMSRAADAVARLIDLQLPAIPQGKRFSIDQVRVLQGTYDWDELRGFSAQSLDLWASTSLHEVDVDERLNRLRLVASRPDDISVLRAQLVQRGVPLEAIVLEVEPEAQLAHAMVPDSLTRYARPIEAGRELQLEDQHGGLDQSCTLGVNVVSNGSRGFLTAAHCTGLWGQVDADSAWQDAPPSYVGYEANDPPFFTHSQVSQCPSGKLCRYTDAAFFRYVNDSDALSTIGLIEGTFEDSPLDPNHPGWYITNDSPSCPWLWYCTMVGKTLEKVGKSAGWTTGQVDDVCATKEFTDAQTGIKRTFICVDSVVGEPWSVLSGDSGAPVFEIDGPYDVDFYGIVLGKSSTSKYWFSLGDDIRLEVVSFSAEYVGMGPPE